MEPENNSAAGWHVGADYEVRGRKYRLAKIEAGCRKRTGRRFIVLTWAGNCKVCEAPYMTKAGPTATGITVNCERHRLSREQVRALATAAAHTPEVNAKRRATWQRKALRPRSVADLM